MRPILCVEHTHSPLAYGCEHVAEAVRTKSPLPARRTVQISVDGKAGPFEVCESCARGGFIPPRENISMGTEQLRSLFGIWPICARCLERYLPT